MKHIFKLQTLSMRFSKGIFTLISLKLSIFALVIFIHSCSQSDLEPVNTLQNQSFLESIEVSKNALSSISLTKTNGIRYSSADQNFLSDDNLYLVLPEGLDNPESLDGFDDIVNSVSEYNAVVSYQETSSGITFNLPTNEVVSALDPTLVESRNYLINKGFTSAEIDQMIIDEGGSEHDLIPLVMLMVEIESNGETAYTPSLNFFNQTYAGDLTWEDYIRCAIVGIGADVIWALGGSNGKAWSKAAMKKAFKTVAKRLLGPIGVAISVATFGVCIAQAYFE